MPAKSLAKLKGRKLGPYALRIREGKGRFRNEVSFKLYLRSAGSVSKEPAAKGLYFRGLGNYKPWLEVHFERTSKLKTGTIDLEKEKLDIKLFRLLSGLLPAGSHIMVAYENHESTAAALRASVPEAATYIGYLLFSAGCTSFKDWYFAEGFMEGSQKLQGNKPLNSRIKKTNLKELRKELIKFIKGNNFAKEKERAVKLLKLIK